MFETTHYYSYRAKIIEAVDSHQKNCSNNWIERGGHLLNLHPERIKRSTINNTCNMSEVKSIKLVLEDGTVFAGKSFGSNRSSAGEVVFNTAMTGYPESLSDPSYKGQILVSTFPLVGNYGVPPKTKENGLPLFFESEQIHAAGLVVSDYKEEHSHWNAETSLGSWLKENDVPALSGIDTRELTKLLRDKGPMLGKIVVDEKDVEFYNPDNDNLADLTATKERIVYGEGKYKILLIDMGAKNSILRSLLKRDTTVICIPWDYNLSKEECDGILISNGPGNPEKYTQTIEQIKIALKGDKPIFGICLGHQLLGLSAGGTTQKLKYGHRAHNHPVQKVGTNTCFITSQNHGFVLNTDSLSKEWSPLFINLNDDTNEGIKHLSKPFFSTQFHPEASGGPTDTEFLFDDFVDLVKKHK